MDQKPIDNKLDVMADVLVNITEDGHVAEEQPELSLVENLAGESLDKETVDPDDLTIQEQIRGEDPAQDEAELETTQDVVDFDSLSEMTKLPKEDLYKIHIPLGDERDPVELGKLKDQFVEAERFRDKQQEMTETLADQQNELMAKRREVDTLMSALGQHLDPQTQAMINQQGQESIARESKLVLQSIPEWSDRKTVAADMEAITEFAGAYGYSPTEINNIVDHRLFKMLRDVSLGHKRVKEARKLRKPPKNEPAKRVGATKRVDLGQLVDRAKKTKSPDHKADAMLAVLGASE